MLKEYYRIFLKIPKLHYGISFLFLLITIVVTQFLLNEEHKINYDRLWNVSIIWGIVFLFWTQIQWIRFALKELISVRTSPSNETKKTPLRYLQYSISLENYIFEEISFEVTVTRRWYPDAGMPSPSDFLKEVKFGKFYCAHCKTEFFTANMTYATPFTRETVYCKCRNPRGIDGKELQKIRDLAKIEFNREVREKTSKFWEMYRKEYLRLTDGKPELYQAPSTTFISSSC